MAVGRGRDIVLRDVDGGTVFVKDLLLLLKNVVHLALVLRFLLGVVLLRRHRQGDDILQWHLEQWLHHLEDLLRLRCFFAFVWPIFEFEWLPLFRPTRRCSTRCTAGT